MLSIEHFGRVGATLRIARAPQELAWFDDILVVWGTFYRDLAAADGLPLAGTTVDLREEVSKLLRRRAGTLDNGSATFGATPSRLGLDGRVGRRLDTLVGGFELLRVDTPA